MLFKGTDGVLNLRICIHKSSKSIKVFGCSLFKISHGKRETRKLGELTQQSRRSSRIGRFRHVIGNNREKSHPIDPRFLQVPLKERHHRPRVLDSRRHMWLRGNKRRIGRMDVDGSRSRVRDTGRDPGHPEDHLNPGLGNDFSNAGSESLPAVIGFRPMEEQERLSAVITQKVKRDLRSFNLFSHPAFHGNDRAM